MNQLMKSGLTALLFSCYYFVSAQHDIIVKGRVMDENTEAMLDNVTISIKGKAIGTVSNSDGEFEFHFPNSYLNDTLYISMLGYSRFEKVIKGIDQNKLLLVKLKDSPVILNEVIVTTNESMPNNIFQKAFENIENTFPQNPFILKGFYRQLNSEDGKNVLLVEAAVNIYDKKYNLNPNFNLKEKIAVNQVRSSNNNSIRGKSNYFQDSNTLSGLLLFNFTRYRNPYLMKRINFKMDSILSFNDKLVYVISSCASNDNLDNRFTLYIDSRDFSFIKIENESIAKKDHYLTNFDVPLNDDKSRVLKLITSRQTYQFRSYNSKTYLGQAISYQKGQVIHVANNTVDWEVTDESMLVINEVNTNHVAPIKENLMESGKNLRSFSKGYNQEFWRNKNEVKLTPLTKRQLADLEEKNSLEEQFEFKK